MGIQAFDQRQAVVVAPFEIRAGEDFMRDLGRLRQVEAVEDSPIAGSRLVRFADAGDGQYATLSVPDGVQVVVWRQHAETAGAGRV